MLEVDGEKRGMDLDLIWRHFSSLDSIPVDRLIVWGTCKPLLLGLRQLLRV